MKNIKTIVFSTLLITSCTNQLNSSIDSSYIESTISISSPISSSNSAQQQADELKKINQEQDTIFKNKLIEQSNIHGELSMYKFLELKYSKATTLVRKKALYQMLSNPRLDYYLNSKYLKDYRMEDHIIELILEFENIIFVPEDPQTGIRIPYVIILPDEKYKQDNLNYKNYAFFQMGGAPVNNQPYYSILNGLMQHVLNKEFVLNTVPNELYSPKIVAFIPSPCLFNIKRNSFIGNRYLDRDNVYAKEGQFSDYRVCDEVFRDLDKSTNNPDTFNEYKYSQIIDIELQNKNIINQAIPLLRNLGYEVEDKVFMTGFSNNGLYTTRFATIYPDLLKATYVGGAVPIVMPSINLNNQVLNYPLGIVDHEEIFGRAFDLDEYNKVAKMTLMGMNENWSNIPLDRYDNIYTRYFDLFGAFGPSQYFSILNSYYSFGGKMLSVINNNTGHYMSENDNKLIKEFFMNNRNNEEPWYPSASPYPEHIIITEKIQDPLLELVRKYPKVQASS
jgi:hypothetical protein